jgi:zinc protease
VPKRTQQAIERFSLDNGLSVIVAPDRSSQLVGICVAYDVGWRSEPKGRTGFAHLFEHLMFQGSKNVQKLEHMALVEGAGGAFNGHTRADLTAYYQALPAGGLELVFWLEADRMGALSVTEENLANQVAVVKEEINLNVMNQPYGGFPWIVLPELAFDSYANSHNGYGAFEELEQASIEDALSFYETYYAPGNAVLAVAGDCRPEEVATLAERHFGALRPRSLPEHGPFPEPPLAEERRSLVHDPKAPQPAFAAGYRSPDPVSDLERHLAYTVAAGVLAGSDASRLRRRLVHEERIVTDVSCELGLFGMDNFIMRDPVLFQVVAMHPGQASTEKLLGVVDEELEKLADKGPTKDELERVATAYASGYWRGLDAIMERAVTLSSLEVIHGRPELLAELPERIAAVAGSEVARAASELRAQHRAVVEVLPGEGK